MTHQPSHLFSCNHGLGESLPHLTTIARLRGILADDFPSFDVSVRRLREAGLLPAGSGGRDGVGSAPLDVFGAGLLLSGLAAPCEPCEAPVVARRIADFRLRYV